MLKRLLHASARMNCARASEMIPLHVGGDLATDRAQALAQHLQLCAACRAQADEYAVSRAWLQTGAQPVFADEFYADIRAAVLRQLKQERTPAAPFFDALFNRRLLYVAASIALLCLTGALAWRVYDKRQRQQTMATGTHTEQRTRPAPTVTPHLLVRDDQQTVHDQIAEHNQRPRLRPTSSGRTRVPRSAQPAELMPVLAVASLPALAPPTAITPNTAAPNTEIARIELQTADPNIRIIWLAQQPADVTFTKDR